MRKKYIVRLTMEERQLCEAVVDGLAGASQKVKRANILLKADADGPAWTDEQIADAFRCRPQTVENVRKKFVLQGFEQALEHRKPKITRPTALDGKTGSTDHRHAFGRTTQGLREMDASIACP